MAAIVKNMEKPHYETMKTISQLDHTRIFFGFRKQPWIETELLHIADFMHQIFIALPIFVPEKNMRTTSLFVSLTLKG